MGQRHQFWIIAKVGGRYHVLAAVHNQWAYGTIPIKACWRLIQMMEHPENKRLARHEITAAAGHDADWWKKQEEMAHGPRDITETMPFPFLMTCLVLATSFDPRVHPAVNSGSRVHTLGVGTSWSQVDNNDGFTILDITDLDKPTYCFTQIDTWREHVEAQEGRTACRTPMTDQEYLNYYPGSGGLYRPSLAAWDVIDAGVLRDLWPDGDWSDREDTGGSAAAKAELLTSQSDHTKPSLAELAFQKAVEAALDDAEMEEALTSVENIPSLPGRLARYMLDNPASAGRPCGARLLVRALKGGLGRENGSVFDLSHWPLLTEDGILHVVKHGVSVNDVTGIDPSNNHNVSTKCVKGLVDLCPSLTAFVAISTPSLSLSDLLSCLDTSKKAYDISHSDHFRAAFGTARSVEDWTAYPYTGALNTVTQVLYYCTFPCDPGPRIPPAQTGTENNDSGLDWRKDITRLKEADRGLDVKGFHQPIVRFIPLHDAMLAPDRSAEWFPQVFQMAIHHGNSHKRFNSGRVCPDFSMALAVGLKDAWRVRPIPAVPYMCTDIGTVDAEVPKCRPVEKGSWTLLVFGSVEGFSRAGRFVGDLKTSAVHYAFLTRDQDGGLTFAGLEDFVKLTVGDGVDPALDELISDVASAGGAGEGEEGVETWGPAETDMLSVDWAKLKLFHEEEAKDIVESFIPVYEEAREAGVRFSARFRPAWRNA